MTGISISVRVWEYLLTRARKDDSVACSCYGTMGMRRMPKCFSRWSLGVALSFTLTYWLTKSRDTIGSVVVPTDRSVVYQISNDSRAGHVASATFINMSILFHGFDLALH